MRNSRLKGFYRQSISDRRAELARFLGQPADVIQQLEDGAGFSVELADHLVENAIGIFALPLGVACNFRINGRDWLIPMVTEESSVIAAASHAAKLLRSGDGIIAEATEPVMIGQLQLLNAANIDAATEAVETNSERLVAIANETKERLVRLGGGARSLVVRKIDCELGPMLVMHLHVHVVDAMGANIVNEMMERLAPHVEALTGGEVHLRILSNLSDQRTVTVRGEVPVEMLTKGSLSGLEVAQRVEKASIFAEVDPYRAATHNKGIMNGVDAVLLATGQDFRAVEAGAHAFAARNGRYSSLSRWRCVDGMLRGEMELPLAVGTVGGLTKLHPTVKRLLEWMELGSAADLAKLTAAAGLAQNLAAILALSTEGIQRGHMSLHARNVALAAGVGADLLDQVVAGMVAANQVNSQSAVSLEAVLQPKRHAAQLL